MQIDKLTALDLGTTKFCLGVLRRKSTSDPFTVDTVNVAARGMRRGMLANFEEAQKSLSSLLEIAERELDRFVSKVVVGVSGSHLKSRVMQTNFIIPPTGPIDRRFLNAANDAAKKKFQASDDDEIIHVLPISYKIDNREWVHNPIGFSGSRLTAKYFIIEADKHYLEDIVRLCNRCGIEVARLIAEPLASSYAVTNQETRDAGVVVADIGGGTTDGIIFIQGQPAHVFNVNIGGELMSNDLAIGLGIPKEEAERAKLLLGLGTQSSDTRLELKDIAGRNVTVTRTHLINILTPRIEELCKLLSQEFGTHDRFIQNGIILTGGGSQLEGLTECFSEFVTGSVRRVLPSLPNDILLDSNDDSAGAFSVKIPAKYATVTGLLYVEAQLTNADIIASKGSRINHYLGSFVRWIKDLS